MRAESDGQIEDVEDQLFRFSRILDSEPRLITLLSEYTAPAGGPNQPAEQRASRRASKNTADLLRQSIELLHGERADDAVRELANLAVSRRGEVVAHVACRKRTQRGATRPTDRVAHPHLRSPRLTSARHRSRRCSAGSTIAVGDEVIDGSLASKLASAETHLPD